MNELFGDDDSDDSLPKPQGLKPIDANKSGLFDSDDEDDVPGKLGKRKVVQENEKVEEITSDPAAKRKKVLEKKMKAKKQEIEKAIEPPSEMPRASRGNSGDEYESEKETAVTKEDNDFIDDDDDLKDVLQEYEQDNQNFDDIRPTRQSSDDEEDENVNFFDKTLATMKPGRRKGAKLNLSNDEQVELTREILHLTEDAWEKDQKLNSEGKPGLNKVKLLPKLLNILGKVQLQTMLLDYDFLGIIKRWIQPDEKGELPNLTIRSKLLFAINKLPIEKDHLKPSGFGKVIMSLWKHPHEMQENKDICQKMIERWSRSVFEKTIDYKKLADLEEEQRRLPRRSRTNEQQTPAAVFSNKGSDRVRIPQPMVFDFVRRPQPKPMEERVSSKPQPESAKGKLLKRMQSIARPGRKNMRAVNMSIEGRKLD